MRRVCAAERRERALAAPAHHRRCNAGALTTPTTGTPSSSKRDQRGPHRDAADEVLGAVDGVDDPLAAGENRCATELFTEHDIVGPLRRQRVAQHLLDRPVGVGHRGQVGFGLDAQIERAEPIHRQRVGLVGQLQRQGHVIADRRSWLHVLPCRCVGNRDGPRDASGRSLLIAAPWIMRRRGAGGDWMQGQLLVTGVSPRPDDVTGEQFVTITGVINGRRSTST